MPDPPHHQPLHPWDPRRGRDYKSFWNSLASTPEGAVIGVLGEAKSDDEIAAASARALDIIRTILALSGREVVLEVGCGIGRVARGLAPHCRRYVGVDISENMIHEARRRCADLSNVAFSPLEKSDLSLFPDASFDAVVFEIVLIHLAREDAFRYLCEARRVLRTGGVAYCQFYNLLHPGGWEFFLRNVRHGEIMGESLVARPRFYTAPEVRKMMEGAGFSLDEDRSRLELIQQKKPVPEPFELIALGRKP